MTDTLRDAAGMLAGMTPMLQDGDFVFCSLADESRLAGLYPLATFREAEGISVILARAAAAAAGFHSGLAGRAGRRAVGRLAQLQLVADVGDGVDGGHQLLAQVGERVFHRGRRGRLHLAGQHALGFQVAQARRRPTSVPSAAAWRC